MVCGPANSGVGSDRREQAGDAFSFGADHGMMRGMTAMAQVWALPWRAAMIVASEAFRSDHRD